MLYAARDEACNHAQVLAKIIMTEANISQTPDTMLTNELTVRPHKKQQQEPKLSSPVCYANSDEVREEFREELLERRKTKKAQKDQEKLQGDVT